MNKKLFYLFLSFIILIANVYSEETSAPQTNSLAPTITNPHDNSVMLLIPAGEFTMGHNYDNEENKKIADRYKEETPEHTVYLDDYYIDTYEITNEQYAKFVEATDYRKPSFWKIDNFKDPKQPVVGISYDDALAYVKWAGKRLPTEAEWEKAARGTEGQTFPWKGKLTETSSNNKKTKNNNPKVVGNFSDDTSVYGVCDMSGNVSEWVSDWYDEKYYSNSPEKNPTGPEIGKKRVVRGGNYKADLHLCRTYARNSYSMDTMLNTIGFRCVVDLKKKEGPKKLAVSEKEVMSSGYNADSSYIKEFERIFTAGEPLPFQYKEKKTTAAVPASTTTYSGTYATTNIIYNYVEGLKGSVDVINETDSDLSICILNSADEVCEYNMLITKHSSHSFLLTGYSNYRTYIKYMDDFGKIYRSGIFNLDPNYDYKSTLVFDLGGKYVASDKADQRKELEDINKQRFTLVNGAYQPDINLVTFLNKTPAKVDVYILNTATIATVESFSLEPNSYLNKRLSYAKYKTKVKYSNNPDVSYDGDEFEVNSINKHITIAYSDDFEQGNAGGTVTGTYSPEGLFIFTIIWIYY